MKNMKNIKLIAVVSVCILLSLVSCKINKKTETVAEVKTIVPVETVKAVISDITEYHKFSGSVIAKDSIPVLPGNTGKFASINVKVGDKVKKDQVLAQIDPSRDGQKYNLNAIKAPVNGTVTTVNGSVGMMTSPQSVFAMIENLDHIQISFNITERYSTQIKVGSKALISFDAFPGEIFSATVTEVNPTMDVMTRTLKARAELDQTDPGLIAGMFASMRVVTRSSKNAVVIPFASLTVNGDKSTLYVMDSSRNPAVARKVEVKTGLREGSNIEILSGIKAGDEIIIKGQSLLSDGTEVKAVN